MNPAVFSERRLAEMSQMIVWVFGASCVGKKFFIRRAVEAPERYGLPAGIRALWLQDGKPTAGELAEAASRHPIIVRWQWDRELLIPELKQFRQEIIVVKVDLHVQVQRVIAREGSLKWEEWSLQREQMDTDRLVQKLSQEHGLTVRYIDGTK